MKYLFPTWNIYALGFSIHFNKQQQNVFFSELGYHITYDIVLNLYTKPSNKSFRDRTLAKIIEKKN